MLQDLFKNLEEIRIIIVNMLQDVFENLKKTETASYTSNMLQDVYENLEEIRISIVHQIYASGLIWKPRRKQKK